MRIAALEPYAALSHMLFLEGLARHSRHHWEIHSLPARGWKWRMRTASVPFAAWLAERTPFDMLFVSDYLNLPELLALLPPSHRDVPVIVYMHENQLTYPLQENEARDHHFALTHLHSMLAARHTLFNSHYHRATFFAALADLVRHVPDVDMQPAVEAARDRSSVLPLGTDIPAGTPRPPTDVPVILWNHRWEYDKDPAALLEALHTLRRDGARFRVRLLGQRFRTEPAAFDALRTEFGTSLELVDFLPERADYLAAVSGAHIVLSTARHEFFGLSTLEALRTGCLGVLPDDLAYPELLPDDEAVRRRFLYPRGEGPVAALRRALDAVRRGAWAAERERALRHTDRFAWDLLAPRYDELFAG